MRDRRIHVWQRSTLLAGALAGTVWLAACEDAPPPPPEAAASGQQIGVNSYLWRASLDTVSFMPLASEDPFGGVIITDWYSPPESPNERFKVDVYVLDRQLHAQAIKTTVFRQVRSPGSDWSDSVVDAKTAGDLENQILTRARQLRVASANAATAK